MRDLLSDLQSQAISAALSSNWEEALHLNQQIVEGNPKNIEALNRLGRAYFELGQVKEARECFEKTLELDSYNQIAAKFLKRIETFSKKGVKALTERTFTPIQLSSDIFLEEPGKTKVIGLLKVAEPQKLSLLSAGAGVNLVVKNRSIAVTDQYGDYLGILPDDLAHHLIRLIHGGNKYQAIIKTVKTNGLTILIREVYRCPRFRNQPSFLDGLNTVLTYSSDNIFIGDEGEEEYEGEEGEEETV